MTQSGFALEDVSKVLQNDHEVVQAAFMQLLTRYNMYHEEDDKHFVSLLCELVSKQVLVPLDIIHVASARGLRWDHGMSILIEQDCSVLDRRDGTTGLLPFMTFASRASVDGLKTDLNTLFQMIKKHPQTVQLYHDSTCSNGNRQRVTKKRDNEMATGDICDSIKLRKLN